MIETAELQRSPSLGVVHNTADRFTVAVSSPQRHLQRIEGQLGRHRRRGAPADDAAGEHIGDERRERHPGPGRHVGEVDDPQLVRSRCSELALHQIRGTRRRVVGTGGAERLVAASANEPFTAHQSFDPAASNLDIVALQLPPHLPGAIEPPAEPAVFPHATDLDHQFSVSE